MLVRDGRALALTGKTFDTLRYLVENQGRLVDKDELLSAVWRGVTVEEANLTQSIYTVRKVLGDSPRDHRFIVTVPGRGYQFVAPVVKLAAASGLKHSGKMTLWPWLGAGCTLLTAALVLISAHNEPENIPALATAVQLTNDGKPKNELVTDGVRVFYASPAQSNLSEWRTFQVSTKGGPSSPFAAAGEEMSPLAISPDRTELLLELSSQRQSNDEPKAPDPLWFQPVAGGPARVSSLRAHDGSWSADGNRIVYAAGNQIGIARRDGTPARVLTEVPGVASGLRWSPSGDQIRFTLHHGVALQDTAVWEVSPQGGRAYPLFPDSKAQQADGEWTPDGRYYLFSQTNEGSSQIWARAEGKTWLRKSAPRPVQLTTGPMQTFLPTPSPDGKRVFFYGMTERSILLKYDKGSGRFERFLPGISGEHVDFSRDGKWIAYSSYPERALWRAAADGSARLQLSPPHMMAMLPAMSPDGTRIAFVGGMPGRPFSIFVVERDGGALQPIVSAEPKGIIEPAWSPDGRSLVLGTVGDSEHKTVLYRFDFAGNVLSIMPGSEGLSSPRWSPDGRYIAALSPPDAKLMLYDVKSHGQTELTHARAAYPSWAHNGQYVYFRQGEKDEAWCRVGFRDRRIQRVISLADAGSLPAKPSRGIPAWINSWAGLTPDDSLLTASEAGSIEVYAASWK